MDKLTKLITIIKGLVSRKFFGKVIISFESGNVVNLNISESFKLD